MSVHRFGLSITPDKFPFTSRRQGGNTQMFKYDRQDDAGVSTPTWMENFWCLSDGQLGTVYATYPNVPDVPAELMARILSDSCRAFVVVHGGLRSTCIAGKSFLATLTQSGWVTHHTNASVISSSVAVLKGVTYLHMPEWGIHTYAPGTGDFDVTTPVAITGVDSKVFTSLVSSISYLVATDGETIYWSSPLDPTEWTPGVIGAGAGAGSTKVLSIRSKITFLAAARDGFFIFTEDNIVYAAYTNNPENPWQFTEVDNSAGTYEEHNTVADQNSGGVIVWSSAGIAQVQQTSAQYAFPEVSQILAGTTFEFWDYDEKHVVRETVDMLHARLQFVNKRFLCVSYGVETSHFEYLLMYDTLIGRWSRLRFPHCLLPHFASSMLGGVRFMDWQTHFDVEEQTFAELLSTAVVEPSNVMSATLLDLQGHIVQLSPVVYSARQLFNCIEYNELNVTRGRDMELTNVMLSTIEDIPADGGVIKIRNAPVPAFINARYSYQMKADGFTVGAQWEIAEGRLPAGFSLSLSGLITGVAYHQQFLGDYHLKIRVWNSVGSNDTVDIVFRIRLLQYYLPFNGPANNTVELRRDYARIPSVLFTNYGSPQSQPSAEALGGSWGVFIQGQGVWNNVVRNVPTLRNMSMRCKLRVDTVTSTSLFGVFGANGSGAAATRKGWMICPYWTGTTWVPRIQTRNNAGAAGHPAWTATYTAPADAPTIALGELVNFGIAATATAIRLFWKDYIWEIPLPIASYDMGSDTRLRFGYSPGATLGFPAVTFAGVFNEFVGAEGDPEFWDSFPPELFDQQIEYPVVPDPEAQPIPPDNPEVIPQPGPAKRELMVEADSDYNPTRLQFLPAVADTHELNLVQRVRGRKVRLVVQNAPSLQGVEISAIMTGVRR